MNQTERIIHVERKVEDLAKKEVVERNARDLQVMRENQNSITERVGHLERTVPGQGTAPIVNNEAIPGTCF